MHGWQRQASLLLTLTLPVTAQSMPGEVVEQSKLGHTEGLILGSAVDAGSQFGFALAQLGDVDGDGVVDLGVGTAEAPLGSFWVRFLNSDGTTRAAQRISSNEGLPPHVHPGSTFGRAVTGLGDLDADGVPDVAVSEPSQSQGGGVNRGAVWILFLNADGTVKSTQKIDDDEGGFGGTIADNDSFGTSLANVGDIDGDGTVDLAVGVRGFPASEGFVWILFLNTDGSVRDEQLIAAGTGGFTGTLDPLDGFGAALAPVDDLDGNGVPDLAVGAPGDDDGVGNDDEGAVWILFLEADGTVASHTKISATSGGFTGLLAENDAFGFALARLGDVDGNGLVELSVGSPGNDDGAGINRGALYNLFLAADGTVTSQLKISQFAGNFGGLLLSSDAFGSSLAPLGDLDGDFRLDLAVGAPGDDGAGTFAGTTWTLFLALNSSVKSELELDVTELIGRVALLDDGAGGVLTTLGDVDGNGVTDLAVNTAGTIHVLPLQADASVLLPVDTGLVARHIRALGDMDGNGTTDLVLSDAIGPPFGGFGEEIEIAFLDADFSAIATHVIGSDVGGFVGTVQPGFGHGLADLGDLDGNGTPDVAVGAPLEDDLRDNSGAVWILLLQPDGTVIGQQKISNLEGGLGPVLGDGDQFGTEVASLGDADGDGVVDIAVGAVGDNGAGGPFGERGAVWILFLNADGTVKDKFEIDDSLLAGDLTNGDRFGFAISALGDVDSNGFGDLAVGAPGHSIPPGFEHGALFVLMLGAGGQLSSHVMITEQMAGFTGDLDTLDRLGAACEGLGDIDGDGNVDLVVAAPGDDDLDVAQGGSASDYGALWFLDLRPGPWSDLGSGLAGAHGVPTLSGSGALVGDEVISLSLTAALENSTAVLVSGLSALNAPFKGGTLVPALDQLFFGLPTGPVGTLVIGGAFPTGLPSGTELYLQYWISDPAGPVGFAASNALFGATP